ncbi:MAG: hypothetical protein K8H88_09730 [Sandaracinaceae bacterium]|nr:hypothetical protein [Sandaracinaceae bacterium]
MCRWEDDAVQLAAPDHHGRIRSPRPGEME